MWRPTASFHFSTSTCHVPQYHSPKEDKRRGQSPRSGNKEKLEIHRNPPLAGGFFHDNRGGRRPSEPGGRRRDTSQPWTPAAGLESQGSCCGALRKLKVGEMAILQCSFSISFGGLEWFGLKMDGIWQWWWSWWYVWWYLWRIWILFPNHRPSKGANQIAVDFFAWCPECQARITFGIWF